MATVNGATGLAAGPKSAELPAPSDVHALLRKYKNSRRRAASSHPVNVVHHDEATPGERLADKLAATIGSWPFLIIQTGIVGVWVGLNIIGLVRRWDPYPFILLNLMFSVQAAYAGPLILLAGNRQTQKDRLTLEHADHEADETGTRTLTILDEIRSNTEITVRVLKQVEAAHTASMEIGR